LIESSDKRSNPSSPSKGIRDPRTVLLNLLIGVLTLVTGYLIYAFADRHLFQPPVETRPSDTTLNDVIQIDVLNGCGDPGMASKCSSFLRARGYDVVEMRNYKTFDLEKSLVIDRAGDMLNAEKVAYAIGVAKENVIQQINQDYYVDVSVVIGKDYHTLRPFN